MSSGLSSVISKTAAPCRGRWLVFALLVGVSALGACGRRGQPEPPPNPAAPAAAKKPAASAKPPAPNRRVAAAGDAADQSAPTTLATRPGAATLNDVDDEDEEPTDVVVSPQPTPSPTGRKRNRTFYAPKEPFVLDPLL